MKKIMPITTLSCLLMASIASANTITKPEGWYLKGSWEDFIVTDYSRAVIDTNNPALGASLGYKKGPWRAEGQYRYASGHHWKMHDFGLNGYYDFDNSTPFSPYVGLGLHEGFYKSRDFSKEGLYALGKVGVRTYLTQNIALDFGVETDMDHPRKAATASLGFVYHF